MTSEYRIETTEVFNKSAKKLAKKYPSLGKDLLVLKEQLLTNPASGTPLGKDCYKIRLKISSKKTGKSGGARVITFVRIQFKRITLLEIYDKSEKGNITDKEISALLKKAE
jgi:hypothetical protein